MSEQTRYVVKRLSDDSPIRRLQIGYMIDDTQFETIVGFFYDQHLASIAAHALEEQSQPIHRIAQPG